MAGIQGLGQTSRITRRRKSTEHFFSLGILLQHKENQSSETLGIIKPIEFESQVL